MNYKVAETYQYMTTAGVRVQGEMIIGIIRVGIVPEYVEQYGFTRSKFGMERLWQK